MADLVAIGVPWGAVFVGSNITIAEARGDQQSLLLTLFVMAVTVVSYQRMSLYQVSPALPRTDEISRLLRSVIFGTAAGITLCAFLDWRLGAWEVLIGAVCAAAAAIVTRGMIRSVATDLAGRHAPQPVIIVGTGKEAGDLAEVIQDHPESRLELVGIVGHLPIAERHGLSHLWLGPTGRLVELMHVHSTRAAIVTPTGFRGEQFHQITKQLFDAGFDVHLSTGVSRLWDGRFQIRSLAHEPLVVMNVNEPRAWQIAVKRALDVVGASIALLIASPILLMTAIAIKIEDGGPVLFRQERVGRDGEVFRMLKFRSMVTDAEDKLADLEADNERTGPLFKVSNDPRITLVGRVIRESSIDELPQLINVIRGEMSLVGPRPALLQEEEAFDDELKRRFAVRPGITGLWQVEARRNASFSAYRRLDLHYVENWTLSFDARILLATAEQIIVSLVLIPLHLVLPGAKTDGVAPASNDSDTVIDLRDRTKARHVAEHSKLVTEGDLSSSGARDGSPPGETAG